ncbi:MAG: hypothetical protein R6U52_09175 [Kosmotogaceae bacterium]
MKPYILKDIFEKGDKEPYEFEVSNNCFAKFVKLENVETEPEMHKYWTDIYIVLEGNAILTLGQELIDSKEVDDGEYRGGKITNPEETELKRGSVAVITAGYPHKLKIGKGFSQLVIKVKNN